MAAATPTEKKKHYKWKHFTKVFISTGVDIPGIDYQMVMIMTVKLHYHWKCWAQQNLAYRGFRFLIRYTDNMN